MYIGTFQWNFFFDITFYILDVGSFQVPNTVVIKDGDGDHHYYTISQVILDPVTDCNFEYSATIENSVLPAGS